MARAAVIHGPEGFDILDLKVAPPEAGEVRVRMSAAGVCHSDLNVVHRGGTGMFLPAVLGHEGAGIVEEVGAGVEDVAVGDHVVLAVVASCGHCRYCLKGQPTLCDLGRFGRGARLRDGTTRLSVDGTAVGQMAGLGTWSAEAVVPSDVAIRIDPAMPMPQAAIIGCGVVTGYGAATVLGEVATGDTVAVIGCGGVGLSGLQGARIRGAERVIAVDRLPAKLGYATALGATDTVDASATDPVEAVLELTGGEGVDVALDFVGAQATAVQAINMTRRGGRCVFTGLADPTWTLETVTFLRQGKTLRGNYMGMLPFRRAFPELIELYQQGRLLLDEMVSREIAIDDVADAFRAMEAGEVARSVVTSW
ncbi:MAG TPA: Zn-dependent alcohol dehydrogenase [Acidimicrobiales bacterium]|jgi:Zn-dependent alcohol dehydrogenase|nr:Zn-dependent alcohol dehydrogenase [Acidimicrobiales bacterium]